MSHTKPKDDTPFHAHTPPFQEAAPTVKQLTVVSSSDLLPKSVGSRHMMGKANLLVTTVLAGEISIFYFALGLPGVFMFATTTLIYSVAINEGGRTWIKGLLQNR